MTSCLTCDTVTSSLKSDLLGGWLEADWLPHHPGHLSVRSTDAIVEASVLAKYDPAFELAGGFRMTTITPADSPPVARLHAMNYRGQLTYRTGAFLYQFAAAGESVDVLVTAAFFTDSPCNDLVCFAAVPESFLGAWHDFTGECDRIANALEPSRRVIVIGGHTSSFVPTVNWNDVVLPDVLKTDLLSDVSSFFGKGVEVYKRLNLKPFRKLLLAGVPGTGKTMLCSALANWALDQQYLVIYVSSAYRAPQETHGATFSKIEHALSIAANSDHPTLILLEELDAYLHPDEKAMVLNVLDGNESSINDKGTLLVATTNYPEAIDERVLKRPGRLDRIFIIPEVHTSIDAELMLRQYLGAMWQDDHRVLVPQLVGYPGAFVREVAVYALTQVAYDDLTELSLDLLERSYQGLKEQIEARDNFLTQRAHGTADQPNGNHRETASAN